MLHKILCSLYSVSQREKFIKFTLGYEKVYTNYQLNVYTNIFILIVNIFV